MNRRQLLRNLMLASGSLASLPAWAMEWSPENLSSRGIFSPVEQDLIRSIADTIIPAGKDPGAITVGTEKFLVRLFEDCYEPAIQENIKKRLVMLDTNAKNAHQSGFAFCTQQQRQELLLKFAASSDKDDKDFFNLLKSETIRGYNTSKPIMVNYFKYKVVPGHYYGCVNVNA